MQHYFESSTLFGVCLETESFYVGVVGGRLKARTHTPTFAEPALESADSSSESADSGTDTPVGM